MVIPTFEPIVGGAERQLQGIAAELARLGHEVTVVTRLIEGTPRQQTHESGYSILRLDTWSLRFGFHVNLLRLLIRRAAEWDVIHCHTLSGPAQICCLAGAASRKPVLLKITRSGRGSQIDRLRRSGWRVLIRWLWSLDPVQFVAITKDALSELLDFGIDSKRCVLIPNGVKLGNRASSPKPAPMSIIYTGRLIPRKRVDLLLTAFSKAVSGSDCRLTIVGAGPMQQQLQEMATHLGIAPQVVFTGEMDHEDLSRKLLESEIFVLPSDSEGMSNSLLEAMAAGLIVIATDIEANRELIRHEENGLLFKDEDHLAQLLRQLSSSSRDALERLGEAAMHTIRSGYSFPSVAARYVDCYHRLLARSSITPPASFPDASPPL